MSLCGCVYDRNTTERRVYRACETHRAYAREEARWHVSMVAYIVADCALTPSATLPQRAALAQLREGILEYRERVLEK